MNAALLWQPTTIWLCAALLVLLYILDRHAGRIRRLEKEREERQAMIERIRFLEEELKKIKGSVPFKLFSKTG